MTFIYYEKHIKQSSYDQHEFMNPITILYKLD